MSLRECVSLEVNRLDEATHKQIATYIDFLRYKDRTRALSVPEESEPAALYAEFANEDTALVEAGFADYVQSFAAEDAA